MFWLFLKILHLGTIYFILVTFQPQIIWFFVKCFISKYDLDMKSQWLIWVEKDWWIGSVCQDWGWIGGLTLYWHWIVRGTSNAWEHRDPRQMWKHQNHISAPHDVSNHEANCHSGKFKNSATSLESTENQSLSMRKHLKTHIDKRSSQSTPPRVVQATASNHASN